MKNFYHIVAAALGIVFVTLKLCHVINWSWWWVTLPFWAWIAFAIVLFLVVCILKAIAVAVRNRTYRRR